MRAERALLDTNVLLCATTPAREWHEQALRVLDWPNDGGSLLLCGQILREYLVVATRPAESNGLGLSRRESLANVTAILGRSRFLDEDRRVHDTLCELLGKADCQGKRIHDANLVATAIVHGVDQLVTGNARDFACFGEWIRVIPLDGC